MTGMHVGHVKNGRLTLDEPTDLPEGSVVPLEIADDWDDLNDEERAELHRELAASIADHKAGAPTYSIEEVLAELGAQLTERWVSRSHAGLSTTYCAASTAAMA